MRSRTWIALVWAVLSAGVSVMAMMVLTPDVVAGVERAQHHAGPQVPGHQSSLRHELHRGQV